MCRCALNCILPPYILEKMAESPDKKVREVAVKSIAESAAARATRQVLAMTPMLSAFAAPTAKKHRMIYDLKRKPPSPFYLPGTLVRSEGQKRVKDPAVNEAYDYSGYTYDFYKRVFQRNSLDDRGLTLVSSVHGGINFNNAFWNGQQMVYGDGDGIVFERFTKALDVVGHELTHGVVTYTSNLIYQGQAGALNEHFADAFGTMILQYHKRQTVKTASWLIGEAIVIPAPTRKAIRSMAAPGTAFTNDPHLGTDPQPKHMNDLYTGPSDNGGVHINSGIPNYVFYLVATALGGKSWEKAGPIWYNTMKQLSPNGQFQDCASLSYQIAGSLYGSDVQKIVKDSWAAVGLTV